MADSDSQTGLRAPRWPLKGESIVEDRADCRQRATPDVNHALGLADFMYNVGYLGQNWTDVHLSFFDTGIKLHRSKWVIYDQY
jgi:hypothetical protein